MADLPMTQRPPPSAQEINTILTGNDRNANFRAAALIVNADGFEEQTDEMRDILTPNTLMRAYWLTEANPTGVNSSAAFLRQNRVPELDEEPTPPPQAAAATPFDDQATRKRRITKAKDLLLRNVPSVPEDVREFNEWLHEKFWQSRGPLSQVAAARVAANLLVQPLAQIARPPNQHRPDNQMAAHDRNYDRAEYVPPFKPEEIGFFDPTLPLEEGEKPFSAKRIGRDMFYRDHTEFLQRAEDVVSIRGIAAVRAGLPLCLRGDALSYYSNVLSPLQKAALRDDQSENLHLWNTTLGQRFKQPSGQSFDALISETYTLDDVKNGRRPSTYIVLMAKLAKAAELPEDQVLRYCFKGIHPELREVLPSLESTVTLSQLMANMELKWDIWLDKYSQVGQDRWKTKPKRADQPKENEKSRDAKDYGRDAPMNNNASRRPDYFVRGRGGFARSGRNFNLPRIVQNNSSSGPTKRVPDRPCFQCGKQGHWRAECPQNPNRAMNVIVHEPTGDEQYDKEEEAYLTYVYGPVEERCDSWSDEQKAYFASLQDPEVPTMGFVTQAFFSEPPRYPKSQVSQPDSSHISFSSLPTKELAQNRLLKKGLWYKGSRYAEAVVRFNPDGPDCVICPDTGCSVSIVDRRFAQEYIGNIHQMEVPMQVKGISGEQLSCTNYAIATFYVKGKDNSGSDCVVKFRAELHIVEELAPNLLLGTDVLKALGITIDLEENQWRFAKANGFSAPFVAVKPRLIQKPQARIILAKEDSFVPPRTVTEIPFRVKSRPNSRPLADCDFAFEPSQTMTTSKQVLNPLCHVISHQTNKVMVSNWTDQTVLLPRNTRLGTIIPWSTDKSRELNAAYFMLAERKDQAVETALVVDDEGEFEEIKEMSLDKPEERLSDDQILEALNIHPQAEELRERLRPLVNVWRPKDGCIKQPVGEYLRIPLVNGWQNKIKSLSPRVYRLSPQDRKVVDETFDALHQEKKMEFVNNEQSPFGWPVFVVYRGSGPNRKGRVVVDIRGLNAISEPDAYPLPLREEQLAAVEGCQFLSTMDMSSSFYQFRAFPKDTAKLAVISHRGKEKLLTAVMGYVNSVAHVQKFAEREFRAFRHCLQVYIDDWLVHSKTLEDHATHLLQILSRMEELNITMSLKKTFIGYPSIVHLGALVDQYGYSTPKQKLEAIAKLEMPRTLKELESYMGMVGYLRHFVPFFAQLIAPLAARKKEMLKEYKPKSNSGAAHDQLDKLINDQEAKQNKALRNRLVSAKLDAITESEREAYRALQEALSDTRWLAHMKKELPLFIDVDASKERGFGVMIYQLDTARYQAEMQNNAEPKSLLEHAQTDIRPIMFLSRQLSKHEMNYPATELEVAAVVWVVRKIRYLIETASKTIVVTDHSATAGIAKATSLKSVNVDTLNLRLSRASQYLSQFASLFVIHKPGRLHVVPDALSRLPQKNRNKTVELENWVEVDLTLAPSLRDSLQEGYKLDPVYAQVLNLKTTEVAGYSFELKEDGLIWTRRTKDHFENEWRLCVPAANVPLVFQMVHDDLGHLGFHRAYAYLRKGFYIHRLSRLLRKYLEHCPQCLRMQTRRHRTFGLLIPHEVPNQPYESVAIDFFEKLPPHLSKSRHDTVLAATCMLSKEVAAISGKKTWTAAQWGTAFYQQVVAVRRWGFPLKLVSDRDPKFVKDVWQAMFKAAGARIAMATAHHSQTAGQAERTNQTLEIGIRFKIGLLDPQADWEEWLPTMELIFNNSPSQTTGIPPHMVTKGFLPRLALDVMIPDNCQAESRAFLQARKEAIAQARDAVSFAALQSKFRVDMSRLPMEFKVGEMVLLVLYKGYKLPEKLIARKFSVQRIGPFKILEKIGQNAYRLELPPFMKIHDVVSVAQLEPYPTEKDPFGREALPPPAIITADGTEMEVEKILHHETHRVGRSKVTLFRVRFKGFGPEHDEYIPEEDLTHAKQAIDDYRQTIATKL